MLSLPTHADIFFSLLSSVSNSISKGALGKKGDCQIPRDFDECFSIGSKDTQLLRDWMILPPAGSSLNVKHISCDVKHEALSEGMARGTG